MIHEHHTLFVIVNILRYENKHFETIPFIFLMIKISIKENKDIHCFVDVFKAYKICLAVMLKTKMNSAH